MLPNGGGRRIHNLAKDGAPHSAEQGCGSTAKVFLLVEGDDKGVNAGSTDVSHYESYLQAGSLLV